MRVQGARTTPRCLVKGHIVSYPPQTPWSAHSQPAWPPGPYPPAAPPVWPGQPTAWPAPTRPVNPGRRLAARIIDQVLWCLMVMLVNVPTLLLTGSDTDATTAAQWIIFLWLPLSAVLYYVVPTAFYGGTTLGKRVTGLRVIRADGGSVGFGRALGREGFYLVGNVVPVLSLLDPLWCLWDQPRQQCLHDKVAGTRVVLRG